MRKLWAEVMYENVYLSNETSNTDSIMVGDINNDSSVDSKDYNLLSDFIVKKADIDYSGADKTADVNSDNKVNVFDAISLRRRMTKTDSVPTDTSWEISTDTAKHLGRTLADDGATWLLQSGSATEFTVTGSSAELVLKGNLGIDAEADYRPRYAVYVDDTLLTDETLDSTQEKIMLFDEGKTVTKTVKVIMLSEAMYGAIGVDCINVNSSSPAPVKATAPKKLNIEFIGDSITCAYGVEGANSYESFKTTTENFTKSYAYLTAQKLNADYSAVCYSGHGIVSGYTSDGTKNSDSLIPDFYKLCSKQSAYAQNWDFDSHKNDVVVINLGTNDINYVSAEPETRSQEFIDGYVDFLKTVRECNKDAYIICTMGTMGGDEIYALVEDAVEAYKSETGEKNIMSYKSVTHTQADGMGSDWHPSAKTQQNSAYVLSDKICQALGMESDQIGLDVAADAVYDVEIDSASGANAAHYVGYDKSFWINTVTGGTNADDIVACLSGIELKSGGEYRLEFDCTSSRDFDMEVKIEGAEREVYTTDGEWVYAKPTYFSDTVAATSEKQHYSSTFTTPYSDENTSLRFYIGGGDSCNVTLSNIKLVKIK